MESAALCKPSSPQFPPESPRGPLSHHRPQLFIQQAHQGFLCQELVNHSVNSDFVPPDSQVNKDPSLVDLMFYLTQDKAERDGSPSAGSGGDRLTENWNTR